MVQTQTETSLASPWSQRDKVISLPFREKVTHKEVLARKNHRLGDKIYQVRELRTKVGQFVHDN